MAMALSGEAGKRDDDESHLLAEQGEEGLLQRSLPQVEPNSLCILIGELNLVGRCVARSPKEMVRQVAATRELDEAEVSFANDNSLSLDSDLIFAGWVGASCQLAAW